MSVYVLAYALGCWLKYKSVSWLESQSAYLLVSLSAKSSGYQSVYLLDSRLACESACSTGYESVSVWACLLACSSVCG